MTTLAERLGRHRDGIIPARSSVAPGVALVVLIALAAGVYAVEGRGLIFHFDEWDFILRRRDASLGTFIEPHNGHLVVVSVVIYKLLFTVVGIDDYWPYRMLAVGAHLGIVVLFFALAQRRIGPWLALVASVPLLFLGAGWQDILWPFQLSYLCSLLTGLGAMLALDRRDRSGDIAASILLATALGSSGLGVALLAGATVELLWREHRWQRIWVVAVPGLLYGLWHTRYSTGELDPANLLNVPRYAADAFAGATGALVGLGTDWGRVLAVAIVVTMLLRLRSPLGDPARVAMITVAAVSLWALTAIARTDLAAPDSSRYVYAGALLILLLFVELARQLPVSPRVFGLVALGAAVAAVGNLDSLRQGAEGLQTTSRFVEAELAALEVARPAPPPGLRPDPVRAPQITAGAYLDAVQELGSPARPLVEATEGSEEVRAAADAVLAQAESVVPRPTGAPPGRGSPPAVELAVAGQVTRRASCVTFRPSGSGAAMDIVARPPGVLVRAAPGPSVELRARRLASSFPASAVGVLPGGTVAAVPLRRDSIVRPWVIRLSPAQPVAACGLA